MSRDFMYSASHLSQGGSQFFINVAHNDFLDWFSPGPRRFIPCL